MDTTTNSKSHNLKHHSELERFKLFYEFATPTKDVMNNNKSQSTNK